MRGVNDLQYAGNIIRTRYVITNECEGSMKDFSLPREINTRMLDASIFDHRDIVSSCTAMPQRHPCHAEKSKASRIFLAVSKSRFCTVPQDDIATRRLKREENRI